MVPEAPRLQPEREFIGLKESLHACYTLSQGFASHALLEVHERRPGPNADAAGMQLQGCI